MALLASPLSLIAQSLTAQSLTAQSLNDQREALREANARAARARLRGDTLRADALAARASAERLAAQRAALAAEIDGAEAEIVAGRARLVLLAARQRAQAARLAEQQRPIVELTAALQSLGRRPTALLLVQPGALDNMIHVRAMLAGIEPEIRRRTDRLRGEIANAARLREETVLAIGALGRSRTTLAARRQELARLEAGRRVTAAQLVADAATERDRALGIDDRARDIAERIAGLEAGGDEIGALAAIPAPVARAGAAAVPRNHAYRLPIEGRLTTGFGEISPSGYRSRGLAFAAAAGRVAVAPAGGRVTYAGRYRGYGAIVIIDHGAGWASLVTGLSLLSVTRGATVATGQPIGRTGAAGEVTVELRRRGHPVDIVALLRP